MAAIIWDDVTGGANGGGKDYASLSPEEQDMILGYVNDALNVDVLGGEESPKVRMLRVYLARHHAELARRAQQGGGSGGAIASKSITTSGITISYAQLAASSQTDALDSTSWGKQYRQLLRQSPLRVWRGGRA